jgi:GR25 family glycosyltransferase involved in LPS biosynthesis
MEFIDKIYIISLERHNNRSRMLEDDLISAGFDKSKIEWVTAIDGNELDITECLDNGSISDTFIDPFGNISKGIYGCALSHQMVYKKFLETSSEIKNCLVLEDDVCVSHTLLRLLLPNSFGHKKLIEEMDTFDWDVIQMGGQTKQLEYEKTDSYVLKNPVKYPVNYAAHSYLITKKGAEALIKSNESIWCAADVNLHCSDVNMYCVPSSYFHQKLGDFEKWLSLEMYNRFKGRVLYASDGNSFDEVVSSTTFGDYSNEELLGMPYKNATISNKIEVISMDWKPFTAPNGDEISGWGRIKLKTN